MASNGKVALVTGADSDVGAAIVQRFAREGFQVAACGASRERAKPALEGAAAHGAAAEFFELDVRKESDAARFAQGAVDRFGRIDAIVNCGASRRIIGTIRDISDEDVDEEMAADLKSVRYVSRAAIPTIAKGGGG